MNNFMVILDEIDTFLEGQNLPKMTHDEFKNLSILQRN